MKEIQVNIEMIHKHGLNPYYYLYVEHLVTGENYPWPIPGKALEKLEKDGWVKIEGEVIEASAKFKKVFKKYISHVGVEVWINEYRELFPKGHKVFKRLVRGDRNGCIEKMQAFVKTYPQYTKERIIAVTKQYIFGFGKSYDGMQCADYFIEKNKISQLAAYLEDSDGKLTELEQVTSSNGTPWETSIN